MRKNYTICTTTRKLLADTITPVNVYLKLRDVFAASILLESSDYHGQENSLSFICCDPIAKFTLRHDVIEERFPDGIKTRTPLGNDFVQALDNFRQAFVINEPMPANSLFGYTTYDAVRYTERVTIEKRSDTIPDVVYSLYRYVIVVDHFFNTLTLHVNGADNQDASALLDRLQQLIFANRFSTYSFKRVGEEQHHTSEAEFLDNVHRGIAHCQRGDVFQLVLSRRFSTSFQGDEFNVYRALRSINPSPYLFYFDMGSFKLFGSSPEAQLQVTHGHASIYPIAGTFRRTGNDADDAALAAKLAADEKENAEHVMLVDLARNDMSRHAEDVQVDVFKEVQFYSHVIHLVSKVTGKLHAAQSVITMAMDTFPAGTLSGAPKPMALNLIERYETVNREFYGGAIGVLGWNQNFNHAIMIRTFLSVNNTLVFQAGAGIVSKSVPENELQEVNNKVEALRKALVMAEQLN